MIIQIYITEGKAIATAAELKAASWFPWLNCKSLHQTQQLAAHRHIRNRGGVSEPFTLNVYAKMPDTPNIVHHIQSLISPK